MGKKLNTQTQKLVCQVWHREASSDRYIHSIEYVCELPP